jgi:hypothetical protein
MLGEDKETAVAKGIKKATGRVRKAAIFFLGALVAGALATPARAVQQDAWLPGALDQRQPSGQQGTNQPSTTNQAPQNSSDSAAQDPQQSAEPQTATPASRQQGTTQTAGEPATAQPSPSKQAPQDTSHSQLSAKEQESLKQQAEKGTSKDRILWTLPNFLTVEDAGNIPALTAAQKFKVVGRSLIDPSEFVLIGFVAGLGQASDSNPSYGQGAQGYAKRYGTSYADNAVENFMASAVLPSVLHQDPRYYQLGRGGFWRRTIHAVSRVVITQSDAGQRQFNYSEVFGAGMAAAISTYSYHPESERSFGNVAGVWSTQIGWDVATYMIKEFWPDLRKKHHKDTQEKTPSLPVV